MTLSNGHTTTCFQVEVALDHGSEVDGVYWWSQRMRYQDRGLINGGFSSGLAFRHQQSKQGASSEGPELCDWWLKVPRHGILANSGRIVRLSTASAGAM